MHSVATVDNPNYDSLDGCYEWAKETLHKHRNDPRPVLYTQEQLEKALTHDDLWNAAQIQMIKEGKMHVSKLYLIFVSSHVVIY